MKSPCSLDPDVMPPHPLLFAMEYRALAELGVFLMSSPLHSLLPRGNGHAVIIIPGLLQSEMAVTPLRQTLRRLGYQAHAWDQGRNLGFSKTSLASLRVQTEGLAQSTRKKVSIVGWSLGGIFARELAFKIPTYVRQVITLAAPFARNPRASNSGQLYDLAIHPYAEAIDDAMARRIRQPLPVPSTAIYSRTDGFVSWMNCVEETSTDSSENIEVFGSHSGLGFNVQALYIIANRLARPGDS